MPIRESFPTFYTFLCGPHTKQRFYCIHKYKKNTTYPTHLKLTVKIRTILRLNNLSPRSMCCNVPVRNFHCSNTLKIRHAGATSMMDSGAANFRTVHYPGTYSKSTLDDKLFNLMGEMNNAVPLTLHPFHPKRQNVLLYWAFGLKSATAAAETWGLKGQILRRGRM